MLFLNKYLQLIISLMLLSMSLLAGPVEPPAPFGEMGSAMYSINDICERLKSGAEPQLTPLGGPASGPGASNRCTLNDVMAVAPKKDIASGAQASEVLFGKSYWSLRAESWGKQIGTMVNQGAQIYVPGVTDQLIAAGYHNGLGVVQGDADLIAANLKAGVDIFGVLGSYNPQVASGDVQASEVLEGKTFSNAQGTDFTGTMPHQGAQTYVPSAQDQKIVAGYHDGQGVVKGDKNLKASNILKGMELFGIAGEYEPPLPPSLSGTAVLADVLIGKTFSSSQGLNLEGTMVNQGAKNYLPSKTAQPIAAGYHDGTGVVEGDVNLVSGNVKSGVEIFGVLGDSNVVDTSSGDAVSGELVSGKKAWVDGVEVTGNLVAQSLSDTSTTVVAGVYAATTLEAVDTDLLSSNVKSGVEIFGVSGDANVVDTSSGDALDSEILTGKKAWVGGVEVTGTGQLATVPSPVPKTGQITLYATGDDGDNQRGVTTSSRFTDQGDGTVLDNLTGLIWLKKANCIGTDNSTFDTDNTGGDGQVYWQTALDFVADLNTTPVNCGVTQTDWRLPNLRELQSLIDYGQYGPALPTGHPFLDVQSDYYWSATTYASVTSYAWGVYLYRGGVGYDDKTTATGYVWPVRGGQ
jgi:hypothetical protein